MSEKRLHIGLFIDTFFPMIDGVVMVVDNYARRMQETADVTVFAPESSDRSYRDEFPYQVVRCKCLDMGKLDYTLPIPMLDIAFMDDLLHERLDIVHVHSPFTVGRMGILYGKTHGVPVIGTMHSQYRQDFERVVKLRGITDLLVKDLILTFRQCDEAWAVNESVAEIFHRDYGFPTLPAVQRNATDMRPVDRAAASARIRGRYGIPEGMPVFLFVGRLNKLKNILFLADALKLYGIGGREFRMIFVGEGQDGEELRARVEADGLAQRVIFAGRVTDRESLAEHYAAADLFLFPSLYDASSLVQIEAASQGTPGVFLRGAATAATVQDGVSGFLSEQNPGAFARRMEEAMEPETHARVSEGARRELYYTYEDAVRDVMDKYRKALERFSAEKPKFLKKQP